MKWECWNDDDAERGFYLWKEVGGNDTEGTVRRVPLIMYGQYLRSRVCVPCCRLLICRVSRMAIFTTLYEYSYL